MLDKGSHEKSKKYTHNKVRSKSISFLLFFKKNNKKKDSSNCVGDTNKKSNFQSLEKDEKKQISEKTDIKTVESRNNENATQTMKKSESLRMSEISECANDYNEFHMKNFNSKKKRESFFKKINILQKFMNYKIKKTASTFHTLNEKSVNSENYNKNEKENNLDDIENNITSSEFYNNLKKSKSYSIKNEFDIIKSKAQKLKKKIYLKKKRSKSKLTYNKNCTSEIIHKEEVVNISNKAYSMKTNFKIDNSLEYDEKTNPYKFQGNSFFDKNNISKSKEIKDKNAHKKSKGNELCTDSLFKKVKDNNNNNECTMNSNNNAIDFNEYSYNEKKEGDFIESYFSGSSINSRDEKNINFNYKSDNILTDKNSEIHKNVVKESRSTENGVQIIKNIECNISNNLNSINNFLIYKNSENIHYNVNEKINKKEVKKNENYNYKREISIDDFTSKKKNAYKHKNNEKTPNYSNNNLNETYNVDKKNQLTRNQKDKETLSEKEIILKLMYNNNGIYFNKDEYENNSFNSKDNAYSECIQKNKNVALIGNNNQNKDINKNIKFTLHKNFNENTNNEFNKNANNFHINYSNKTQGTKININNSNLIISKNPNFDILNNNYNQNVNKYLIQNINQPGCANEEKNKLNTNALNSKCIQRSNSKVIKNIPDDLSKNENLDEEKGGIINKYLINPLYNLFAQTKEKETNDFNISGNKKIDSFLITKNYTNELRKTYKTMYDIYDVPNISNKSYTNSSRSKNNLYYMNPHCNYDINSYLKNKNIKPLNHISVNNKGITYCNSLNKNMQNDSIKNAPIDNINYLNKNIQNTYLNNKPANSEILKSESSKCVGNRNYNGTHTGNINYHNTSIKNSYTLLFNDPFLNTDNKNGYIQNTFSDKISTFSNVFANNNNSINTKGNNNYESNELKKSYTFNGDLNNARINYNIDNNSYIFNKKNYNNTINSSIEKPSDHLNCYDQKNISVNDLCFRKPLNNLGTGNQVNENINYNNNNNNNNNNSINILGNNSKINDSVLWNNAYLKKCNYVRSNTQLFNKNSSYYNYFQNMSMQLNQKPDVSYIHEPKNEYMKNSFYSDLNDLKNKNHSRTYHSFSVDKKSMLNGNNELKTKISNIFKNNDEKNVKRAKSLGQLRISNLSPNNLDIYQDSYINNEDLNNCNINGNMNCNINYNSCNENRSYLIDENKMESSRNIFINNRNNELTNFSQKNFRVYSKDDSIIELFKNKNEDMFQKNKNTELLINNNQIDRISNNINFNNNSIYNNNISIDKDPILHDKCEKKEELWLNHHSNAEDTYYNKNKMDINEATEEKGNYFYSLNIAKSSDFLNDNILLQTNKENGYYNIISDDTSNNFKNAEKIDDTYIFVQNVLYEDNYKRENEKDNHMNETPRYHSQVKKKKVCSSLRINSEMYTYEKLDKSDNNSEKKNNKSTKLRKKSDCEEKKIYHITEMKNKIINKESFLNNKLKKMEAVEKESEAIKNTTLKKYISIENNINGKEMDTKNTFRSDSLLNRSKNNSIYSNKKYKNKNLKNSNIDTMKSVKNNNVKEEMNYKKGNINSGNYKLILDSSKSKQASSDINRYRIRKKDGNSKVRKRESSTTSVKSENYNIENEFLTEFCKQGKESCELKSSIKKETSKKIIKKIKIKKGINQKTIEKTILNTSSKSNKNRKKKKKKGKRILREQINELNVDLKNKIQDNLIDQKNSISSNNCVNDKLRKNDYFLNEELKNSLHKRNDSNNLLNIDEDSVLYKKCNKGNSNLKNESKLCVLKKIESFNEHEISFFYKEVKMMNHILSNIDDYNFLNFIKLSDLISIEKNFINNNIYINKQLITSSTKNNKLNENSEDGIMYDNNFSIIHLKHDIIYLKKNCLKVILNVLINNTSSFYEIKVAIILLKFFTSIEDNHNVCPSLYPLSLINALIQKFSLKVHKRIKKKNHNNDVSLQYNSKKMPFHYLFICDGRNYLCINDDFLKNKTYKNKIKLNNLIGYYHYINLNRLTYYLEKANNNITIQ